MNNRQLAVVFASLLAVLLVTLLPLRVCLALAGLSENTVSAIAVGGSVWNGWLKGASWRGRPLGDLSIGLLPLSEIVGTRRLRVAARTWSATLAGGRIRGFENATGLIDLKPVSRGIPIDVRLLLKDANLNFSEGRCRRANGNASVQITVPGTEGSPLPLRLDGSLACHESIAVLELVSSKPSGQGLAGVQVRFEIDASGRYRVQTLVESADAAGSALLQAAGFQAGPGGFSRVDSGSLFD